jgi:hypothetical protein
MVKSTTPPAQRDFATLNRGVVQRHSFLKGMASGELYVCQPYKALLWPKGHVLEVCPPLHRMTGEVCHHKEVALSKRSRINGMVTIGLVAAPLVFGMAPNTAQTQSNMQLAKPGAVTFGVDKAAKGFLADLSYKLRRDGASASSSWCATSPCMPI